MTHSDGEMKHRDKWTQDELERGPFRDIDHDRWKTHDVTMRKAIIGGGRSDRHGQTDRGYPDDDPLGHLSCHREALTVGLSLQCHHQHEVPDDTHTHTHMQAHTYTHKTHSSCCCSTVYPPVNRTKRKGVSGHHTVPLVRVGLALLPHVIGRGLTKV